MCRQTVEDLRSELTATIVDVQRVVETGVEGSGTVDVPIQIGPEIRRERKGFVSPCSTE